MPRLSVSSWSLHRALGEPGFYGPEEPIPVQTHGRGEISLLELPGRLPAHGVGTLEICHFHFPRLDSTYLQELRSSICDAGVSLFNLLIDAGDITHPEHGERDLEWTESWIEVAAAIGAEYVRVVAGKSSPGEDSFARSLRGFRRLLRRGHQVGVKVMTENWFDLLSRPEDVFRFLDALEGEAGLCFDFGNWGGPQKYANLAAIAPRAASCHTKARFEAPREIDRDDYVRCLEITREAGFKGPYTLIYDGPDPNEWECLALERQVVQPYL